MVDRAHRVGEVISADDPDVLIAASYLHDIGYAPALMRTRFHPVDGAMHLHELGEERLAGFVAYHSGAEAEARLRGLGDQLGQFQRERSEVADALTYCDVTTALGRGGSAPPLPGRRRHEAFAHAQTVSRFSPSRS
jgi:HD superfamily phosphodiesterase